jgi:hypothetical protein
LLPQRHNLKPHSLKRHSLKLLKRKRLYRNLKRRKPKNLKRPMKCVMPACSRPWMPKKSVRLN